MLTKHFFVIGMQTDRDLLSIFKYVHICHFHDLKSQHLTLPVNAISKLRVEVRMTDGIKTTKFQSFFKTVF